MSYHLLVPTGCCLKGKHKEQTGADPWSARPSPLGKHMEVRVPELSGSIAGTENRIL